MRDEDRAGREIVEAKGLAQISDESAIVAVVDRALAANAKSVADYKAGKKAAFNALFGSVMRETKGKANPQLVRQNSRKAVVAERSLDRESPSATGEGQMARKRERGD